MRIKRLLPLLFALTVGCAKDESMNDRSVVIPEHHRIFIDALVEVIAKSYPEFELLPDNEHRIRFLHSYSRDMHALVTSSIAANPTDDADLLNAMRELDEVTVRELQLHAVLIDEGRYDYTESEAELAKELRDKSAVLVGTVSRFVAP